MRIVFTIAVLLLVPIGRALAAAPSASKGEGPPTVYTRQTAFGIPFFMDPAEPGARRATEVQLNVSEDNGPWRLVSKTAPSNGSIQYRAARDGEYRFMIRTKDDHGEVHPAGPPQPELVVVVDTDPPVLELYVERGSGGEVRARWRVRDPHLRYDSLRLEYQVGVDGPWIPVAVDLPAVGATRSAGDATWLPEARQVPVLVRAEVADFAGNLAKAQRQIAGVTLNPAAAAAGVAAAKANESIWPAEPTEDTPLRPDDPPTMARKFPAHKPGLESEPPPQAPEEVNVPDNIAAVETLPPPRPNGATEEVLAQENIERRLPIPDRPEELSPPPAEHEPRRNAPYANNEPEDVDASEGPQLPWIAATPAGDSATAKASTPPPAESLDSKPPPSGEQPSTPLPQPTNLSTRRFEVGYSTSSAPQEIKQVEVWGTHDQGHSWRLFAVDLDHRSPALVSVNEDGLYGFRIVVVNNAGSRGATPQDGDAPDILVNVDTAKPVARLTSTGTAAETPSAISIRWEAADALLDDQPIGLYYSPQPNGPWVTIVDRLENLGEYLWQPDPRVPPRVYLRMVVRDQAGNVQAVDAPVPLTIPRAPDAGGMPAARPISNGAAYGVPYSGPPPGAQPGYPPNGAPRAPNAPPAWNEYRP